ncbi:ComEC/Rec2 family competence protein [Roseibium sp. RKSG952]|uniref:ComEC/Rec2 family competence protein n=1 Tax=Roseibium sp. RKSG952 TaxID=2529384 RepID=UPI0018AD16D9
MAGQGPDGPGVRDRLKPRDLDVRQRWPARDEILAVPDLLAGFLQKAGVGWKQSGAGSVGARSGAPTTTKLRELWQTHQLLWTVFAFAAGILANVQLPQEPALFPMIALAAGLFILSFLRFQSGKAGAALVLICAVVAGAAVMSLRTHHVAAPRIEAPLTASGTGTVSDIVTNRRGKRLIIGDISWAENHAGRAMPQKIRLSVPDTTQASIGDRIKFRGRLFPPAGPVRPGGYDFSFRAYFSGIGATGFSFGAPEIIKTDGGSYRLKRYLDALRADVSRRIRGALPAGDASALAVALLVGDRSGLSEHAEEALRAAGLAHVLAISGLHMALFAGGAFAAFLFLLSLSETAALSWPTHRVAAVAALLAALAYLALSGASVATQRSFIMIALVFLGILTARRGLTLRSVALAGGALLVLGPERLFYPGFQMSFAAVLCLVAVYEGWSFRPGGRFSAGAASNLAGRLALKGMTWGAGLLVTALVAGLATGFIGAYHFARIAPMSLIGNLLGMPVFSLVVMPAGVLSMVLMPLGLSVFPLTVMAWGLDLLVAIAGWTAGLSIHDGRIVPLAPMAAFMAVAALFLGLLLRGPARGLALLPAVVAGIVATTGRPPDVLISERGTLVAARDEDGVLRLNARRSSFGAQAMLEAEGVAENTFSDRRMSIPQLRCDAVGCVVKAYGPEGDGGGRLLPLVIALPKTPAAVAMDCRLADVLVAARHVPPTCGSSLVLNEKARASLGAVALWLSAPPERRNPEGEGRTGGHPHSSFMIRAGKQPDVQNGAEQDSRVAAAKSAPSTDRLAIKRIKHARSVPPRPWHQ